MENLIATLQQSLSDQSKVLTAKDTDFEPSLERWCNVDVKTPTAVVQPSNEDDVVLTVREAIKAGIPFVPATGGHSPYSSIGKEGIIIDLQKYKDVVVDAKAHTAKVRGGVLMKEFQVALSKENQWTAVANGNTVGVIPYMIGGGISSYTALIGYGCENIVAARLITSSGDIVEASETQNPDLLWAIRGAGQFMGLVIELTMRTYDMNTIGLNGVRQVGTYIFPVDKSLQVCQTLSKIVDKNDHASAGHFMVMNDPTGQAGRILMVSPQYFGSRWELQATFKPLIDLGALFVQDTDSTFETHSDHLAALLDKDGYKRFSQIGMTSLHPQNFAKLCDLHQELIDTLPGTERSAFTLEWHTPTPASAEARKTPTSFGFKDVDIWLNVLTWYNDPNLHDKVIEFDQRAQKLMRADVVPEAYVAYTNTSREDPIEDRYKGAGTVDRLRELKRKWDPKGVFTTELL